MQGSLRHRLVFLLAAGGLGLCGYAGLQWYELPHYSEDDLKVSTELNLQIDLARQGINKQLEPERMEQLRQQERGEIQAEIDSKHQNMALWLAGGMALLALAGGQLVMLQLSTRRTSQSSEAPEASVSTHKRS